MRVVDCKQYSPEWWDVRCGMPTASAFDRICTPAKGEYSKAAAGYIAELIADRYDPMYGVYEDYQSDAMRAGHALEPEARRFYEFDREVDVKEVGFCVTDDGRFGASPDGLPGDGALEIKSPTHKTQVQYLLAGGLPNEYKPQCHGHLIVTGCDWCDFLSYAAGLPKLLVRVVPDDYTDKLRDCLNRFHDEYIAALEKIRALDAERDDIPEIVMF